MGNIFNLYFHFWFPIVIVKVKKICSRDLNCQARLCNFLCCMFSTNVVADIGLTLTCSRLHRWETLFLYCLHVRFWVWLWFSLIPKFQTLYIIKKIHEQILKFPLYRLVAHDVATDIVADCHAVCGCVVFITTQVHVIADFWCMTFEQQAWYISANPRNSAKSAKSYKKIN